MKKMIHIVAITALFFAGLPVFAKTATLSDATGAAAKEISRKIEGVVKSVAVLDIQSDYKALSDFIVSELNHDFTNMLNPSQTNVVPRDEFSLSLIQKESDYQYSGAVSDDTIQGIGEALGADCIVLGKISLVANEWILYLRAVTVAKQKLIASSQQKISKKDKTIKYLVEDTEKQETVTQTQSAWNSPSYSYSYSDSSSSIWDSENKSSVTFVAFGLNAPFNISSDSDTTLNKNAFPLGISAHFVTTYMYVSFKGNLNCDFVAYSEKTSGLIGANLSLGATPIHNDYLFLGIYGTIGFDKISNYSYVAYGGSVSLGFNFSDRFGIFLNVDATRRSSEEYNGDEEEPPYAPLFLDSWRICPSISFAYTFLKF